ncbi:Bug family tripartite tricarboxylate transporter substrate binding protein [Candidatus Formimonas warabiya]|uniref:Tripartite tricarboxylate transporter substrate binding protein n=1 Tax=Formimonas warabiya TaxID=1761012 RepID=A0A3G1KTC3_FORW1|nr:tripartite tricarboxylate transporter substrate binding protein [Candidatus Formimonas warabiya]ATW25405.1 hypothetical protein DCMF_12035 [Candidatus Formimonas warabiya]
MRIKGMVVLAMMVSLVLSLGGCSAGEKAYPNKPIEFVVPSSAGGSGDAFIRTVADILTKEKLINVPTTVVNKPGGSGAIAFKYSAEKIGDPYVIQSTPSTFIVAPILSKDCPNYTQFTPIAMLATEPQCIIVKADSPYQTLESLVEGSKSKSGGLTWSFSSVGSYDHLMALQFARMTGAKVVLVPQPSDNESIVAVLGGHADVASMSMRSALGQVEAGKVKMIGVACLERAKKVPDVPTLKELGYDIVMGIPRAVCAPKDIPENARDVLIDAFKKLAATERWQKYVDDECLVPEEHYGDDYTNFLKVETEKVEPLLRDAGLVQ